MHYETKYGYQQFVSTAITFFLLFLDFATPEEVYSSMVSDLRQTCPIDRLSLILANSSTSHVYRYIVETPPSSSVCIIVFDSLFPS